MHLDDLIDDAVVYGELSAGTDPHWLSRRHDKRLVNVLAQGHEACLHNPRNYQWTAEEDQFLRDHIGYLSDEEMGEALGRSHNAVKVRRTRSIEAEYRSASTRAEWLCLGPVCKILGKSDKGMDKIVDRGLLPAHTLPLQTSRRVVTWFHLVRFAVNPENWIYFEPERVTHPRLRRLIQLRKERWNDEWWTAGQAAAYHGVTVGAINANIHRGHLPAKRWNNWRIKRSDAVALHIGAGKGAYGTWRVEWTARADRFMVLTRAMGMSLAAIAELMKAPWNHKRVDFRFRMLARENLLPQLARAVGAAYNADADALYTDWRDHARRFKRFGAALQRVEAKEARREDLVTAASVVGNWLAWRGDSEGARRMRLVAGNITWRNFREHWENYIGEAQG